MVAKGAGGGDGPSTGSGTALRLTAGRYAAGAGTALRQAAGRYAAGAGTEWA